MKRSDVVDALAESPRIQRMADSLGSVMGAARECVEAWDELIENGVIRVRFSSGGDSYLFARLVNALAILDASALDFGDAADEVRDDRSIFEDEPLQ